MNKNEIMELLNEMPIEECMDKIRTLMMFENITCIIACVFISLICFAIAWKAEKVLTWLNCSKLDIYNKIFVQYIGISFGAVVSIGIFLGIYNMGTLIFFKEAAVIKYILGCIK